MQNELDVTRHFLSDATTSINNNLLNSYVVCTYYAYESSFRLYIMEARFYSAVPMINLNCMKFEAS